MLMVAVAYPAMGTFRIINKEVQLSLSAHSTAGASGPLRTKKDGIMAATAVMNSRHITKVTEEEAMRAIKGMTSWVRQQPAAESLVYEADEAAQEGNEYMWDLYSSPTPEKPVVDAAIDPAQQAGLGTSSSRHQKRHRGSVDPEIVNDLTVLLSNPLTEHSATLKCTCMYICNLSTIHAHMHDVKEHIVKHMSSTNMIPERGVNQSAMHDTANTSVHANVNVQSAVRRHNMLSLSNACSNTNSRPK